MKEFYEAKSNDLFTAFLCRIITYLDFGENIPQGPLSCWTRMTGRKQNIQLAINL